MSYVDNKILYAEMVAWQERRAINPDAEMSPFIANAILLIADGLTKIWKFQNYTWRDEMRGDAIEICCRYLHKYDTQYKNVHAYITKTCERAFINRLKKENKQLRVKYRYYLEAIPDLEEFDEDGNPMQFDYSFYRDMGEKLKGEPFSYNKDKDEPESDESIGLSEFLV